MKLHQALSLSTLCRKRPVCVSVFVGSAVRSSKRPPRGPPRGRQEVRTKHCRRETVYFAFAVTRVYQHRITCSNLHNVCTRPQRLTGLTRSTCAVELEWQDRTRILEPFPHCCCKAIPWKTVGLQQRHIHTTLLVLVGWHFLPHELLIEEKDTFVLIPCTIPLKNTSITHRFFHDQHTFFHFPSLTQQRRSSHHNIWDILEHNHICLQLIGNHF